MDGYNPTESPPGDLPGIWRERAEGLRRYSVPAANAYEDAAAELEQALQALDAETLTLVEAAALCGYSTDHLGSLVRNGKLRNYGRKGSPRIRRSDLPVKSTTSPGRPQRRKADGDDIDIRSIIK